MAKVYFVKKEKLKEAFNLLGMEGKALVKVHFGEEGNTTYVKPEIINLVAEELDDYFLTDCNVLYKGKRTETEDHLNTAKKHGFKKVKIADEDGEIEIQINKNHFKKIKVGKLLKDYKNILVFSHFKGHPAAGFGGALKNLGMGFGSRAGKLAMHAGIAPKIDPSKCQLCQKCKENCPANAIETINNKNVINKEKCIGCAKCIAVCGYGAVRIPWGSVSSKELQERIVEYCYGISKSRDIIYFNALTDITESCDCVGRKQEPFMEDIGFLASKDPVAIDQASLDLVNKKTRKETFKDITGVSGKHQLKYGEEIGLGSREYNLVEL
jgi:hypothetical protein